MISQVFLSLVLLNCPSSMEAAGIGVGQRFNLAAQLQLATNQAAQVFVPDYYVAPTNGKITLVCHLHGAAWRVEEMVYQPKANVILFNLHLPGLSGVYQSYFSDALKFPAITNAVLEVLRTNKVVSSPQIEKLVLTSFSAGYAGIREILKSPANYQRVDALLLADSLHTDSDPEKKAVKMKDFLQFAIDARDSKKILILTHSSVPTTGYESTTQTADYLVSGMDRSWTMADVEDPIGTRYRHCDAGRFMARGYRGQTGDDHIKQFQWMNLMMERLVPLLSAEK